MPTATTHDAVAFVGLMPHAPILAAGIGHAQHHQQASRTIRAMEEVARHAVEALPDTVVLISPHSPRRGTAFGIWDTSLLRGSFAQFGATENDIELPLDQEFAYRLISEARALGLRTWRISTSTLDYGAGVPLSYLTAAGWKSPTVVVGLPDDGHDGLEEFGRAIEITAEILGRRVAVIASGDMSHRLTKTSPNGYHEDGPRFDQTFVDLLRAGAMAEIRHLDVHLVENAGEDVVDATRVALAAVNSISGEPHVLSYEGPFGVGYGVAILIDHPDTEIAKAIALGVPARICHHADLPLVARCAVAAQLSGDRAKPLFVPAGDLSRPRGIFVTIRTQNRGLRGCSGTPIPTQHNVIEETWHCARCAAFHDPRFPALAAEELSRVRFSVSILSALEPATSVAELDPAVHGISIESLAGRKSVLLPGIKGVSSAAEQVRVARRKGGIDVDEPVIVQRFTAQTFHEPPPREEDE